MAADEEQIVTEGRTDKSARRYENGFSGYVAPVDFMDSVDLVRGSNGIHGAGVQPATLPREMSAFPQFSLKPDDMDRFARNRMLW